VIDPGFYDWSDSGDYGSDQGDTGYSQGAAPDYPPYTDDGATGYDENGEAAAANPYYPPAPYGQRTASGQPAARAAYAGNASTAGEEQLTVMFKDGRAPQSMRNYMMDSKVLTDMDSQHYERIPLDQIDIAATTQVNRARGVEFAVPIGTAE
jgi:hypothetical protein